MKILALIDIARGADMHQVRSNLEQELRESWRLYADGTLREAYATATPTRVVFVLEARDVDDARARFAPMPLVAAGLVTIEFEELRPFINWSALFR
jgi:hypothetical protein